MADGISCATLGERAVTAAARPRSMPMPDHSSVIAHLWPARHRRRSRHSRRFVTRTDVHLIVAPSVPAAQSTRSERILTGAWTLYSRWEWTIAKARAERARRRAHPPWR
ncbi:hypothetical protein [Actinomadura sp. 3N407]|uniref:hypothetical protein n=1 Tax=Actinomadura sp. 3N407 TaxID=3457423 RepID=UPI003FCDCB66